MTNLKARLQTELEAAIKGSEIAMSSKERREVAMALLKQYSVSDVVLHEEILATAETLR